ncbi:MAG: RNA polymerase sigma factor, partial [Ignavibacteria bacterium]|nr:RNA polymerase sigma factor [Ignavibacteria bacterium]
TLNKIELSSLLNSSINGDLKSFNELANQIRSISYSYFLSKYNSGKIFNHDDCEDLTQNVFVSFSEQYKKISNIEHWLRRVLFLTFVNWYKKQKRHNSYQLNEQIVGDKLSNDIESEVDVHKISLIISQLNDTKQKIIKMRFWEGLKFIEIAEKLNKNEAAVKKMLYRSLNEIKSKLE